MPIFEHSCQGEGCKARGIVFEGYFSSSTAAAPLCSFCGVQTKRAISTFASPFVGAITARYNDSKCEGAHQDGHWAWKRNTLSGTPERVFIDTFQARKEFMKSEGLVGYEDTGPNLPNSDGKRVNTTGLPGSWI